MLNFTFTPVLRKSNVPTFLSPSVSAVTDFIYYYDKQNDRGWHPSLKHFTLP